MPWRRRGRCPRPKLSEALFAVLERDLAEGPVAHRSAGPDLDAVAYQHPDRAPFPQRHDLVGDRADAASSTLAIRFRPVVRWSAARTP